MLCDIIHLVMSVKVKGVCDVYGGLLPFSLGSEFSLRFLTLNSEIKVRTLIITCGLFRRFVFYCISNFINHFQFSPTFDS